MIVTYIRSSSYNTWDNCQMQYFQNYVLGLPNPAGAAASKGNLVHKVLELLAARTKAIQDGQDHVIDDGMGRIEIEDCTPENLMDLAYVYHEKIYDHHAWEPKDKRECMSLVNRVLEFNNGQFDPRKCKVIAPESYFDFEIDKPWAEYYYKLEDGTELKGRLRMKGSIDLVTQIRPGMYEMIDYKTGRRSDFATGTEKSYEKLCKDFQLRLYQWAGFKLWPDIDDIMMTIFYVKKASGGPFTLPWSRDDLPETEDMIRKQFEYIKRTVKPQLNPGPPWSSKPNPKIANFKCAKLCAFSKPSAEDPSKSTCQLIRDEILSIGIDKVTQKRSNLEKLVTYQDGGGKKNVEGIK